MKEKDIRWLQRFSNFKKAFNQLEIAVDMDEHSDLEREGLIQRFEYTYELAWNTMKDFLEDQGYQNITGSKDAVRQAVKSGLINDGEMWFDMIESRKLTSHTYDEETSKQIAENIIEHYYGLLKSLIKKFDESSKMV